MQIANPRIYAVILIALLCGSYSNAKEPAWFDRQTQWNGFTQSHFRLDGVDAYLVEPSTPAPGKPWIWRARFPGYHAEMDVTLVKRGYHIAYVNVGGLFGNDEAMRRGDLLWEFAMERGLSKKVVLEGVSRGGLMVYNWSARHPERVACIYCDTPVCDFKSWPGGKGKGIGSAPTWKQCLAAYKLSEDEAMAYAANPIDHAAILAKFKIPMLHIVSDNDVVVPPAENTDVLAKHLQKAGHSMAIIRVKEGTAKSHGHHFTHPDQQRVVDFIVTHTKP